MSDAPLPPAAEDALARGRVIEAIKIVREARGLGLKEAKDVVDAHRGRAGKLPVGHAGTPDRRGNGRWVIVLVVALLAWWWVTR